MIRDPDAPIPDRPEEELLPRVFLREPGWRVAMKVGSQREFCHNIAPGEDAYHRLADGEIFVHSAEERLCLPCADRRGLLHFEPKKLGKPLEPVERQAPAAAEETLPVAERDAGRDEG